jgi:hypothetical protein
MNVAPQTTFEAVIDTGETGLAASLTLELSDNMTASTPVTPSGVVEIAAGVYAARGLTAPATEGQYTLVWKAAGEVLGVEDLVVTYTALEPAPGPPVTAYATVDELARILQLGTPSAAQLEALQRVLDAAALEIDEYLARPAPFAAPYPALVVEVNLERAVDHWKAEQSPFGIIALGGEAPPSYSGRNSWRRHASTLLPLKEAFGVA